MSDVDLWHGDARELVALVTEPVRCILTDPPFGVNYASRRAVTPEGKKWSAPIDGDLNVDEALDLFHEVMVPLCDKLTDPGEVYVFTRWDVVGAWIDAVKALPNLQYKAMLVWDRGYPGQGDLDCNWGMGFELVLYCKRGRREMPYRRSGVIAVDKPHPGSQIHQNEKPVALLEKFIEMSTDLGDLVVDPFAGSASTLVAARNLGRRAIGIEKDDTFYARAKERLTQVTFAF